MLFYFKAEIIVREKYFLKICFCLFLLTSIKFIL